MSRLRTATVALSTALLVPVLPADAAPRRTVESWPVAGDSVITVTGNGYGHGHGMSQWGARGAARAGLSWQQIAEFYYPGTTWGSVRGPMRVLITADTTADVQVLAKPGLKARSLDRRKTWSLTKKGAKRWRIVGTRRGVSKLQLRKRAGWRTWRKFAGAAEFSSRTGKVTLVVPGGRATYRGRLRSVMPKRGSADRDTVNVLPMEAYLRGVVPREVPALWEPAAVSAQSVAARTYAAAERAHPSSLFYDLCDTASCQVYGGVDDEHPAADAAIKATARQGLFWEGRPAFTQFSASSGGWTSAGSMPFLVAQEDPYDAAVSPYRPWTTTLDDAAIEKRWPAIGDLSSIEVITRDGNGEWGGRVQQMALAGSTGRVTVTGDDFRVAFGLRSEWITFTVASKATPRLDTRP